LAIAIAPVLIMVLVGSLVFFLLGLIDTGEHEQSCDGALLVCFGLGFSVSNLDRRGNEHAMLYGGALAVVTALWILRFVGSAVGHCVSWASFWWCASK